MVELIAEWPDRPFYRIMDIIDFKRWEGVVQDRRLRDFDRQAGLDDEAQWVDQRIRSITSEGGKRDRR